MSSMHTTAEVRNEQAAIVMDRVGEPNGSAHSAQRE
jgi:hypothetical protein